MSSWSVVVAVKRVDGLTAVTDDVDSAVQFCHSTHLVCHRINSRNNVHFTHIYTVVTYSFRDTISLPMAVGLFLLQARLPGTLCVTNSMNRR